ncbi:MAG: adenine phosphoribosyltransferase [Geminicoccaceae bacterium]|jgi:adenine phosphoribosyltransferase|nr:adenine phosphoribosyltransferase [Geminicoccaceae bacterium]MCE3247068.1 adenine phosphoribosyltransferase [Geminicoccaceae bacterium]
MDLKAHIRQIPNFPKHGILFYDISTLLQHPDAFQAAIDRMADLVAPHRPERLIGIESRGFLLAAPLALRLGVGLTMVRKRGKLPGSVVGHAYNLEYGSDTIEVSADLIPARSRVVVVDDLIATGGTAAATVELLAKVDAAVAAAVFLIELSGLNGRNRVQVPVSSLLAYDG